MIDLDNYSKKIRRIADSLLAQSRIIETLQAFGSPQLTGSYELDLMYGPDIDVVVVTDDPRQVSRAVLDQVLDQGYFQRYEYGDFVRFSYPNRPKGYILVLAVTVEDVYWEIEIWFLFGASKQETKLMDFVCRNLTPETRETILRLKHQRKVAGKGKHAVSSVDIYKGVLKYGLSTLGEIEKHFK